MNNNGYLTRWSQETIEQFRADAAVYSHRELADKYGIASKSTVGDIKRKLGVPPMSEEAKRRIYRKVRKLSMEGRARMTPEQVSAMNENIRRKRIEVMQSERRRIAFGLEQRTNLHISANTRATRKRAVTKFKLIRRNHYISLEHDSRDLYYNAGTTRSEYLETKYRRMFNFIPENGFNPEDSVWVNKTHNRWKLTS